jgi:hypothetical protein
LFSERHGIALDKFFDAAGLRRSDYAKSMHESGFVIAYNTTPCIKGKHTIRNRYGRCVVCDPKQLAFNERAEKSGYVYVAFSRSKKLVKVGFTEDIKRRHSDLLRQSYAGAKDWSLEFLKKTQSAGRIEIEAHKILAPYLVKNAMYEWDGKLQNARETYSCSLEEVINVLEKLTEKNI